MASEYSQKRNFHKTPEPSEKPTSRRSGSLHFVIQRHQASHLHYDFRLELDGALKSWAVPKGPSLNPAHKRLAVKVEDHPLAYAKFHGTIPEGNYGAGTVTIWDKGTYTPYESKGRKADEETLLQQLAAGHLTIILQGKKLRGEFALIKMSGREENAWILIKKRDRYATDRDVTAEKLKPIPKAKPEAKITYKQPKDLSKYPKGDLPRHVSPMLATLVPKPFSDKEFLYEIKWDGYRAISEIENSKVALYSRNQQDFSGKYPEIINSLQRLPFDAVLDGEIVVMDDQGLPNFQLLQEYQDLKKGHLVYIVFDILYLNGRSLIEAPLIERKKILKQIWPSLPYLELCEYIKGEGEAFFKTAKDKGLEGIIAKKIESKYKPGVRDSSWQKIKTKLTQDAIICGYTEPTGSRSSFGALILGAFDKEKLTYIGHVGTGFSDLVLKGLHQKLETLKQERCPFEKEPPTNGSVTWVKPKLVCEVEFTEWTREGVLRQPSFKGLREDKTAKDVTKEGGGIQNYFSPDSPARREKKEGVKIGQRTVFLSHLDKVFWPKEGYTKGDLIAYYRSIAPIILTHLKDRPQSLLRYPNGIEGEGFYQKNVGELMPDWIKTEAVKLESENRTIEYCVCQDEASLIYLINLGCIDLHPWNSRIDSQDNPDYAVIDLDPEDIAFEEVVKTALVLREVLEKLEIDSFCKTSGSSGIHIYIPLGAKYTYEQARDFILIIANIVNKRLPEITSLERSPANRQGKVYLDCYQNSRGQTLASAYSVRPKPGATVSAPLLWPEVTKRLTPSQFTIKNMQRRLEEKGDLFAPVLKKGIDLKKILDKIPELF